MIAPPFRIELRPLLVDGGLYSMRTDGVIDCDWLMAISSEQSLELQAVALWHETLHLLLFAAGIPAPHDEDQIEALARRLAAACPEVYPMLQLAPVTA